MTIAPDDFAYVSRLVHDRSAVVLEPGKEYLVEARLAPLARQFQLGSVHDLLARAQAQADDELRNRIVEAMVTTETFFFRDRAPFEALRQAVLPDLIRRRVAERRLAIWSAGCASGQEPYSVALLIREAFPELLSWKLTLLATDLSQEMLARARAGRYTQLEVNRGLPAALLVKYFEQHGVTWQLAAAVRALVEFRALNLAQPWPPLPRFDLVLLRNVMIYFDTDTRKAILKRVGEVLAPDGLLLLGGAETTFNLDDAYERAAPPQAAFYRRRPGA